MSEGDQIDNTQSITDMLKAMNELKQKLQAKKAEHLEQLKTRAINLQKQIDDANAELTEVIQMLKSLEITPDELEGFPQQIISAFTSPTRRSRTTVLYYGEPMSAAAACRKLGLQVNGDSAVRVLQRYLKAHPSEHIQLL